MSERSQELVVILHGIGMPKMRMAYVNHCVKKAGYQTLNLSYPSLRKNIEDCAAFVEQRITQSMSADIEKVHIVAHSMGAIVALHLFSSGAIKKAARAVLVAPPYKGSEVADFLHGLPLYNRLFGPAGAQLTTGYRKDIGYVMPSTVEIGVIAGTRAYEYPFFLGVMKKTGTHDGLVSLTSTRIPGIRDHITIRMSHSFLLEASAKQAVHFLEHGRFKGPSDDHL